MTTYDPSGPQGITDQLDYKLAWTVPSQLPLIDRATGQVTNVSASGQTLTLAAVYVDQTTQGIATFDTARFQITIQ